MAHETVQSLKFDPQQQDIRREIIASIAEYLKQEGYASSALVLQQEADIQTPHTSLDKQLAKLVLLKRAKKAIEEGDWTEVEKLCTKYAFKNFKSFLYVVYKQRYFELIEKQEYQKAFGYLCERLKPLEGRQADSEEFRDLCYLLTCRSVQDAPSFKSWDTDKSTSRAKLVEQFTSMLGLDTNSTQKNYGERSVEGRRCRLMDLMKQAVAYQIDNHSHHSRLAPQIKGLMTDYKGFTLPNELKNTFTGHTDNIKCLTFVGSSGVNIISGSSDNMIRLWEVQTGRHISTMRGHTSRIWDVDSNSLGDIIVSASGDSTSKIWRFSDTYDTAYQTSHTLEGHKGDVYSAKFHPGQHHVVTGGYDKTVRLFDITTGQNIRTFVGHNSSVSRAIFNPSGNLIITGSKDSTIKFWDISSGICVRTISSHLGEVTSVEVNSNGTMLLSGSKDNANRLWEMSTARPVTRFKGHQNTTKNFVRCSFGADETLVLGGSEDGCVYIWDIESGDLLQKLQGHTNMVYSAVWNKNQMLAASCSQDGTIKTWESQR
ncbi:hypothetical protein PROFUN_03219 [Planoprotostelium fungivorum]|uniref:WD40 repeat-containing protein SMU1 n=1 Tax=Planoprotostelium fungivorum TaxID=1890364 RepID=A0A2P6NX17_9EUKA|nr:hypothetical protein PROFUN_03219 [Planoprotostelium fungivorum]